VLVDRPDKKGRIEILKVHMKKVHLAPDVCRQGKVVEEFSALEATEEAIMYAAIH
jgi:ATP-dependent Zn protease